jgi:hypothetical protein
MQGNWRGLFQGDNPAYAQRAWGKHRNFSVRIAGISVEIRIRHPPNTSHNRNGLSQLAPGYKIWSFHEDWSWQDLLGLPAVSVRWKLSTFRGLLLPPSSDLYSKNPDSEQSLAGLLPSWLFDLEDGSDILLRNVSGLPPDCTALYPQKGKLKSSNFVATAVAAVIISI